MKNILQFFLFSLTLISCTKELSHPLTVKGAKLGLDYDKQLKDFNGNKPCENDVSDKNTCRYKITEMITAEPSLLYSLYNNKKVLGQVELRLNSPGNFITFGGYDLPCLKMYEIKELISMYRVKYGHEKTNDIATEGWKKQVVWEIDDLKISFNIIRADFQYGLKEEVYKSYFIDGYATTISYEYVDEMKKLLKNEKTHNGDVIGDKI